MMVPNNTNKLEGLKKAVEANNIAMIKQWITLGAPLPDDASLVRQALKSSSDATVAALIDAGAVRPSNANDILLEAVTQDRVAIAKRIFANQKMIPDTVALSLINGADPDVSGSAHMQMLEHVLSNAKVVGKQSMLEKAVGKGHLEAATMLVENGAKLSEWLAFFITKPGLIGPLVRMGMDLHYRDSDGYTPILLYAASSNVSAAPAAASLVSEAIGAGADPLVTNSAGKTLLDQFLQKYSDIATRGSVTFTGTEEDRALVARLLDMGIVQTQTPVQASHDLSADRLRLAIVFGAEQTIKQEIARHGMNIPIPAERYFKGVLTPMQVAAAANSADGVRALHALGMDVNEGGQQIITPPLGMAVMQKNVRAVAALLACGANHKIKISWVEDGARVSLLAYAAQHNLEDIAKLLRGAETSSQIEQAIDAAVGAGESSAKPGSSRSMAPL